MSKFIALFTFLFACINIVYVQSYTEILSDITMFDEFASLPLSSKYGNVKSIKLIYDYEEKKTYYINSKFYKYHYQFCLNVLNEQSDLYYFNELNYSGNANRRYFLGNINFYPSLNEYALELSPSDLMTVEQLNVFYTEIVSSTFIGEKLHLLLNTDRLESLKQDFSPKIPTLNPSEIYKQLTYQAISCYENTGRLKFVATGENLNYYADSNVILVMKEMPLVVPLVRGIILTKFQTPLSHASLLGQNRKIPICVFKSSFTDSSLLQLANQNVYFEVRKDTFLIREVARINPSEKPIKISLKADLEPKRIVHFERYDRRANAYIGNKAANFWMLKEMSLEADFKVPEASFAIPFFHYNAHIQQMNIADLIGDVCQVPLTNQNQIEAGLKKIRDLIHAAPIDSSLVNAIRKELESHSIFTTFRFRSSTNAEDASGFSGAGLYASKTVDLNDSTKTVERALKLVWASLWSYEAFMERAYFGINQLDVCMGILVHRSFPNEAVNGVAITKNIYRDEYVGFVINAQLGDESVVNPKDGVICDQFVCFPESSGEFYANSIDIITYSSLNQGELVMTKAEIQHLATQLEYVKRKFISMSRSWGVLFNEFAVDVEFKLDENSRILYLKQVRPYND
jgi:pyruvate, water dikinase